MASLAIICYLLSGFNHKKFDWGNFKERRETGKRQEKINEMRERQKNLTGASAAAWKEVDEIRERLESGLDLEDYEGEVY